MNHGPPKKLVSDGVTMVGDLDFFCGGTLAFIGRICGSLAYVVVGFVLFLFFCEFIIHEFFL